MDRIRDGSAWRTHRAGGLALWVIVVGCGDDGGLGSTGDDPSSSSGTLMTAASPTAASDDATGSTGPSMTGLDSTGSTGPSMTGLDSTGSTGSSGSSGSSTGVPGEPPAVADDVYSVRVDTGPLQVEADRGVLANDVDPEGLGLSVDGSDPVSMAGGTVTVEVDGAFEYTPPVDFFGDDHFTYMARNDDGVIAMAVVRITVIPSQIAVGSIESGVGGFVINGAVGGDESGFDVSGGGDVDGDGLDDLLVSSADAMAGAGRTWVVFGKADGAAVSLSDVGAGAGGFEIRGEVAGDEAGHSAAIVGDIDGDGLADILVGAPLVGLAGFAYLVHGKADGEPVELVDVAMGLGGFPLEGDGTGEDAGFAVAGAGDVNGDGRADLVVGAPEGGPIPGGGRAYVVFGKTDDDPVLLDDVFAGIGGFAVHGAGFDDNAGDSVAGAGDVNGDGLADVLVGARLADAGGIGNAGRCYLIFGRTNTSVIDVSVLGASGFFIDGEASFDEACTAVGGAGDVDGDGRADLVVGAPGAQDEDTTFQGRVYVIRGKGDSDPVSLADVAAGMGGFVIGGEAEGDFLGTAAAGGGDVDGDGFSDVVLGTPNVDIPGPFAGRGYVIYGKGGGGAVPLAELGMGLQGLAVVADAPQGWLGWETADAGDVNGDGYADVIISASRRDSPGGADAGRSYVVFGGNFSGAATHRGGELDDELVGRVGADVMIAGAGADVIQGGGGSDVIYGGAGDDVITIVGEQFFRIDGGGGFDTLAIADGDNQIELSLVPDVAIRDVEVLDIDGTGVNVLSLEYRDLRALVGPSHVLRVAGGADDALSVDLSGGAFEDLGVDGGIHTWTNGAVTLEVVEPLGAVVEL